MYKKFLTAALLTTAVAAAALAGPAITVRAEEVPTETAIAEENGASDEAEGADFIGTLSDDNAREVVSGNFVLRENSEGWTVVKYAGGNNYEEVTLPESYEGKNVTALGDKVFYSNHKIKKVTFPSTYKTIGEEAFFDCQKLETVDFGNSMEVIGKTAFSGTKLKELKLPATLTTIDKSAFCLCKELKEVTIPANVTTFGPYCFELSGIEKVTFESDDNIKEIGYMSFEQCKSLKSIKIPSSVEKLGYGAFAYCEALETADITSKIKEIDTSVFSHCGALTTVYIPGSVKRICNSAFQDTKALKDIYFGGSEREWLDIEKDIFNESLENATKHYNKSGSVSANEPSNPVNEVRDAFSISYNSVIPFSGKTVNLSNFGEITVSYNGSTYKAEKIKVNKKLKKFQITKLSSADKKAQKLLKKLTKKDSGLAFSFSPYNVCDSSEVTAKISKSGELKKVLVKIGGRNYKCKKADYDWDSNAKVITFKGENFAGSYTVK